MIRHLLFDFDGTLCDNLDSSLIILNHLAPRFRFRAVDKNEVEELRHLSSREFMKYLGLTWWKLPFVVRAARKELVHHRDNLKLYSGVPEVLKSLQQMGIQIGILSSNSTANIEWVLSRFGVQVDFVVGGVGIFGKARALRTALKRWSVPREQIAYVGDETRDIEACQDISGLITIGVTWGYNSAQALAKVNPTFLAQQPRDLLAIVKPGPQS